MSLAIRTSLPTAALSPRFAARCKPSTRRCRCSVSAP